MQFPRFAIGAVRQEDFVQGIGQHPLNGFGQEPLFEQFPFRS